MSDVSNQIPTKNLSKATYSRSDSINPKLGDTLEGIYGSIDEMNQDEVQNLEIVLMDLYGKKAIQQEQYRFDIFQDVLILDKDHYQSVDAIYQLEYALSKTMRSTPGYYALHILESLITYCVNRLTGNGQAMQRIPTSNRFKEANNVQY